LIRIRENDCSASSKLLPPAMAGSKESHMKSQTARSAFAATNIQAERTLDMRTTIAFAAIIGVALFGSMPIANAQTGEFAGQVPSSVIRDAWQLQDQLQRARSGMPANAVDRPYPDYDSSSSVKPPGNVATTNGAKAKK
jgi:hypothetical protein